MASVYDFKPKFQGLLRPCVNQAARLGITANQVTLLNLMMCAAYGYALLIIPPAIASLWIAFPLIQFLRMGLNAMDGMLAREHHQASKLGAVLNEAGDILCDLALYIPVTLFMPQWLAPLLLSGVAIELAGNIGFLTPHKKINLGPFGKSDRAVAWSLLVLLILFHFEVAVPFVTVCFYLLAAVTLWRRLSLLTRKRP